ncbi:MAG TPA: hypothetical protein VKG43_10285 [Acidimicrobiales bacterium]|nr:hypothetical protein [Acidimicrobiales bacterium]
MTTHEPGWWLAADGHWYPPHLHPDAAPATPPGPAQPPVSTPAPSGPTSPTATERRPWDAPSAEHRRTARWAVVSALVVVVVGVVAGGLVALAGSTASTRDASAAVVQAVNQTESAKTAQLQLTGSVTVGSTQVDTTGSGQLDLANHAVALTMNGSAAGQPVGLAIIYVDGILYAQVPGIDQVAPGKTWLSVDPTSLGLATRAAPSIGLGANDPSALLQTLGQHGNTVTDVGPATVDGVSTEEYTVVINPAAASSAIDGSSLPQWLKQAADRFARQGGTYTVCIDGSGQLRRLAFDMTLTQPASAQVHEVMDFSNFGAPVSITAPPADQVVSLSDFLAQAGSTSS